MNYYQTLSRARSMSLSSAITVTVVKRRPSRLPPRDEPAAAVLLLASGTITIATAALIDNAWLGGWRRGRDAEPSGGAPFDDDAGATHR